MTRRRHLVACCLAALVLAGCSGSDDPPPVPRPTPIGAITSYVALGDSYVAGPEIDDPVAASGYCLRSTRNYPALLAADLGVTAPTDVSCGGATTDGVLSPSTVSELPVPAQLDAVKPDTQLVTVGIGGNDDGLTANLFVTCLIPQSRTARVCQQLVPPKVRPSYPAIQDKIVSTLDAVTARAPTARVVLVGYLRIVDGSRACPRLRLDKDEAARAAAIMDALERTQRQAAREAGVEFVSVRDVSKGHDACAADAWVNGLTGVRGDGAFLHPNAAGMRAVADTVLARLRS